MNWTLLPRVGLLTLSCAFLAAHAQTPAPRPALKTGTEAVKSLGKGSGAGMPMLDKEQLRACFNRRDELEVRLKGAETGRAPLDAEKAEIMAVAEALAADRLAVDAAKAEIDQLGVRFNAFAERVEAWNAAVKQFNESGTSGSQSQQQRQRDAIATERTQLEEQRKLLEAEKTQITESAQATVAAYNAKVTAHQQRANGWNERNRSWNEASTQLETERADWVETCADRRYREDDEIAIKAGR
jgi:chromosome segregation ATPase